MRGGRREEERLESEMDSEVEGMDMTEGEMVGDGVVSESSEGAELGTNPVVPDAGVVSPRVERDMEEVSLRPAVWDATVSVGYGAWKVRPVDASVGSWTLDKRVRRLMRHGKVSVTRQEVETLVVRLREGVVDAGLTDIMGKRRETVRDVLEDAVVRVSPMVVTSSKKRSGSVMKVPTMVSGKARHQRGMHYLVTGARVRSFGSGIPLVRALAQEIVMVLTDQECYALTKYRMVVKDAKANRMYLPRARSE